MILFFRSFRALSTPSPVPRRQLFRSDSVQRPFYRHETSSTTATCNAEKGGDEKALAGTIGKCPFSSQRRSLASLPSYRKALQQILRYYFAPRSRVSPETHCHPVRSHPYTYAPSDWERMVLWHTTPEFSSARVTLKTNGEPRSVRPLNRIDLANVPSLLYTGRQVFLANRVRRLHVQSYANVGASVFGFGESKVVRVNDFRLLVVLHLSARS